MRDDAIVVSAWLRRSVPAGEACTAECEFVTQVVELDQPLPDDVPIVAPDDSSLGCG